MKHIMTGTTLALLLATSATAGPLDPLQAEIQAKVREAKKGVIVAVTDKGVVAAETAWLLSSQIIRDSNYAPLLLVLKQDAEREKALKTLALSEVMLPALIYYDRDGREVARVVGVLPSPTVKHASYRSNFN